MEVAKNEGGVFLQKEMIKWFLIGFQWGVNISINNLLYTVHPQT